ncbi:hypothetical protein [Pseudomonas sp. CGJS7]|uniref:hypothetical protein n=1 Tax=Pseudomonas sp. CGJS7 TaxID=3109348 RepID=UPI00300853E9
MFWAFYSGAGLPYDFSAAIARLRFRILQGGIAMRDSKLGKQTALMLGLLVAAFTAVALNDVIVAGRSFTCANTCVVGVTSGGGWYVYDSNGGWLRENTNDPDPRKE